MATGTIKTKTEKGFGFIKVAEGPDVFFHMSACNGEFDNLQVGQTVQFDVEKGERGPKATNVVAMQGTQMGGNMGEGHDENAAAPDMSMAA